MDKARRYNKGKIRYELISNIGLEELAKVYTKGAEKYTIYNEDGSIKEDGANNWRKGMSWMDTIASVKRHIQEWEKGEDIDELGTKHLANAAWGLFTILDYYKSKPHLDDRPHKYLNRPKIGLDIDEVLCDWLTAWRNQWGIKEAPTSWFFDRQIKKRFEQMGKEGSLEPFYLQLSPLLDPKDIPFEPHCYITSRPCSIETTTAWLDKHGFPTKPVYSVSVGQSKVDVAKEAGIEIFVDDSYDNFVALNNAGICCFLYDQPHNQRYDVGFKRLFSLKDLVI